VTGLVFALAYFALTGIAARSWGERFLFGLALAGIFLFLAGVLHVPLVVGAIVAPIAGFALRKRRDQEQLRYPRTATVVMLLPVAIVLVAAMLLPLNDFDGRVFWLKKAKAIAHEGAIDGPFFRGEVMENPRNHYPLLVPLDAALVFMATRDADDRQTRGLFVLVFLALLLVLRRGIARQFGEDAGAWSAALAAWLPPFLGSDYGGTLSGHADIALAAFAACAFFAIAERESPLRCGVWLAAMVLTKNEGLPFALLLLAPALAVYRLRIGAALVPLGAATLALFAWHARLPPTDVDDLLARLPLLGQRLARLGPAIARVASHMVALPMWGAFWIAVALCCALAAWRRMFLPLYVLVGMLAIYVVTYMVHTWPLANIVDSSIDRLLMHLIAPALFVIAAALAPRAPAPPPATFRTRT
jgi:hypothetical protein